MRFVEPQELQTERLKLRQWISEDFPAFAELNADPAVMEYFPSPLSLAQSNQLAERLQSGIAENGWGLWAVEVTTTGEFIGFVGLNQPGAELPFTPCVEIGWRIAHRFWGHGYATEAGKCALDFAFAKLHLNEVVSFTSVGNARSRAVMRRLGLKNSDENFLHPLVPSSSELQEHVLYKLARDDHKTG